MSQQIKRLERGLRTQLFTRGRGGLELTEAGFRLLDQAPHLLAQAEVLRQALACCERDGSAVDRLPGTPAPAREQTSRLLSTASLTADECGTRSSMGPDGAIGDALLNLSAAATGRGDGGVPDRHPQTGCLL